MEKTAKMVEEITNKRKMTDMVKSKLDKRIFLNFIIAIVIVVYICIINIVYMHTNSDVRNIFLKIFAMIGIIFTVITFEIAYRKDSGKIAICGIEFLIVSIIVLYLPHIYSRLNNIICRILLISPIFFEIYYILKTILIYIKTEKEYQNNLSDVKEILKDDN